MRFILKLLVSIVSFLFQTIWHIILLISRKHRFLAVIIPTAGFFLVGIFDLIKQIFHVTADIDYFYIFLFGSGIGTVVLYSISMKDVAHTESTVHGLQLARNAAKGTARWAGKEDIKDIAEFGPPDKTGGTVVGKLDGEIVRIISEKAKIPLPQHTVVVAGTGAGKTFSFVSTNIISAVEAEENIIVTDPKGELLERFGDYLKKNGYELYVFNLVYPEFSLCWNPIVEAQDDSEVTYVTEALIESMGNEKENAYFVGLEKQAMKAYIYLLKYCYAEEMAHLRNALSLTTLQTDVLNKAFEYYYSVSKKLPPEALEAWRSVMADTYGNAVSGINAKLSVFRDKKIAFVTSKHEINFNKLVSSDKKFALFVILPVPTQVSLKPLLSSFFYFLFKRMYDYAALSPTKRLIRPVRFLLDEFANIGKIPNFIEIISTARSVGIKIQFILQGLKQLEEVYAKAGVKAGAEIILANCPIQEFLGGDDATTLKYFSDKLGETAVYAENERFDLKVTGSIQKTETITKRKLMTPDELGRLSPDHAIVTVRGAYPLYLEKVGWTELPQAKEIINKSIVEIIKQRKVDGIRLINADVILQEIQKDIDEENDKAYNEVKRKNGAGKKLFEKKEEQQEEINEEINKDKQEQDKDDKDKKFKNSAAANL